MSGQRSGRTTTRSTGRRTGRAGQAGQAGRTASGRRSAPPPEDEQTLGPPGDPQAAARTICLRQLDRRACTRAELQKILHRRGIPDDAATTVLDRLTAVGLVDDAALADGFALAQHRERGLSGRAVAFKLRRRGIDEAQVSDAIGQIDTDSERAVAERLVARKLRSMDGLEPQVIARRLIGLLARKGYGAAMAYEVVRAALAERGAELQAAEWEAAELES